MAVDMSFLLVDDDFYAPWDTGDPGVRFVAGPLPAGWRRRQSGAWTHWIPPDARTPDQGWKVHVSASLTNAPHVLAVVTAVADDLRVPFKHLAGRRTFLLAHDKHANRVQSGKFCTLYPQDQDHALLVLRRLEADLRGIDGPFVLTDRRFGDSTCVSYRYGAFRGHTRVDAEGHHVERMTAPDGTEVDDERRPEFRLPPGIADPFRRHEKPAANGPLTLHGYAFDSVIQHSNAGGAYRFRSDDNLVFVKEARAHNGYTADESDAKTRLQNEFLALRAIHARAPGLCPRPIELFHHWEHSYLVTELVPGMSLYRWMVTNNPAVRTNPTPQDFADYHRRCLTLLDHLDTHLDRLHDLGWLFIDLSPTNVLVDENDQVRLVDFEAAQRIGGVRRVMGTPGYLQPQARTTAKEHPLALDRFGQSAVAQLLLFPHHEAAERNPRALDHLHADLSALAPIPDRLWDQAALPPRTPDTVSLHDLAERTADCLEAMAQPDHPDRVYPTIPLGYQTNTRALAYGTAGVLHALHRAGRPCDPAIVRRLRDDSLRATDDTAPGYLVGTAGIADVLAELGEVEAAETLLLAAADHPLAATSATFGGGAAGAAFGLLAHHRRTGDDRWLDRARRLLDGIPDDLTPQLSRLNRSGLVGGRTGVAFALLRLHRATGDPQPFERGLRLLGEELAYAQPLPVDGLGFKIGLKDRRVFPYLFAGSAGYAAVLSRYLQHRPDAEFGVPTEHRPADALERCLRACTVRFAVFPGLFTGLAGLAAVLADVGRRLGRPHLVAASVTSAHGLVRSAIPRPDGVAWLGEPGQRLSAELWSGSAGVLLALRTVLDAGAPQQERSDRHGRSPAATG
ncbi:class III lanthionine synthetase LanKC [Saccharothrix variisporea]|uniref:Lanthionine synthetase-like protein n=1 Tax=Saccharothrix variisporea TaxID=543527 RepID=A0A495X2B9_9PSEU|nr:class III lanthionine synthetase LanKC [Saccharothrix variisporea]RKT67636.1 lanthionine synthetase-like protein [Saccharothrix variisporea]